MTIDPELEVINNVLKELEKVKKNRRESILSFVSGRLGISLSTQSAGLERKALQGPSGKTVEEKTQKIDEFVESKNPRNDYQKAATLAFYLNRFEGKAELNSKDFEEANRRSRHSRKFSNIRYTLNDAMNKYGYFTQGQNKRTKILSIFGERVVEALPDEAAVKALHKEKGKKRGRKKSKKKTKKGA